MTEESLSAKERQVAYWRLMIAAFGAGDKHEQFEAMAKGLAKKVGLPESVLDPGMAIDTLVQRYPELRKDFLHVLPEPEPEEGEEAPPRELEEDEPPPLHLVPAVTSGERAPEQRSSMESMDPGDARLRRALVFSKMLLNSFGPNTWSKTVSAQQYQQWTQDVSWLERALGYAPGGLLRGRGPSPGGAQAGGQGGGAGASAHGHGGGRPISEEDLRKGLASMEGDLVKRMALREVLKDSELVKQLTPSMALVEQILRDKSNLSGEALNNARRLVRAYVDQVAEVMKLKVEKASRGKQDRAVPPKRTFRNLDLKKTVWKNLTNYDTLEKRLMVDRLFYRRSSQKDLPTRMIVVVDQSGSMVDAMVQSTILASIFAGLPRVEVHLLAFDTQVVDLTPWVSDPFEVLLRTNLGGGTLINMALIEAEKKIVEPRNTSMVLISDFYEGGSDQVLFDHIKALKDSGVHFIPVGALMSGGHISVSEWFRTRLKEIGLPILSGSIDKLIKELRYLLR